MRILMIEDEERFARHIIRGLNEEGHQVDLCTRGEDGRAQALELDYDVIVLDWMLPGIDGLHILAELRGHGVTTPVMMLTARVTVKERVAGLRRGADDYLVKPFAFEEFLARLEALHRRTAGQLEGHRFGSVELDGRRRVLSGDGVEVELTAREFSLARELWSRGGDVVPRYELFTAVWGARSLSDPNIVDVYVGYLRRKLASLGTHGVLIRAVRGVGFKLVVDPGGADPEVSGSGEDR